MLCLILLTAGCTTGGIGRGSNESSPDFDPNEVRADGADLTDEQVIAAVKTAVADSRIQSVLKHRYRVVQVRLSNNDADDVMITVEFEQPLGESEWPIDVCAIDTQGQPITGAVWIVREGQITAVSPQWGDGISCFPF